MPCMSKVYAVLQCAWRVIRLIIFVEKNMKKNIKYEDGIIYLYIYAHLKIFKATMGTADLYVNSINRNKIVKI